MILRKSSERGSVDHGWLKARHSFSFGSYYDAKHMHFGPLRVINQDIIKAGAGFPEHSHENMEIITYIIRGELSHKDSTGGGSTIYPNKVQRMSAGTGIMHSEFNNSSKETELLQMWVLPNEKGHEPSYEENFFEEEKAKNCLQLLVSENNEKGSLFINRDIHLYRSFLEYGNELIHHSLGRYQWIQLIEGKLEVNGIVLESGDGMGLNNKENIILKAIMNRAHFLLFDMN